MTIQREIFFMRHGEARPRKNTNMTDEFLRDELSRELTEKGRRETFHIIPKFFDCVIASPAWRAIETAISVSGRNPNHIVIPLSTHLWPPSKKDDDWKYVDEVFVNGGERSLKSAYSSATLQQLRACERITAQAGQEIRVLCRNRGEKVLIVGHALHLQALALEMMHLGDREYGPAEDIKEKVLGPGEYFSILVEYRFR